MVALTRLRDEIDPPKNEEEAYGILESLLSELLHDGKLRVPDYGLSSSGRESFESLVALYDNPRPEPSTDPKDLLSDVIQLYRTNIAEFNQRRAGDLEFRRRSDEANSLRLL